MLTLSMDGLDSDNNDSDCVVCYMYTTNGVKPCNHRICATCIKKWYKRSGDIRCPCCRRTLHSFGEFDSVDSDVIISVQGNEHFGITLSHSINGVSIVKCKKSDIAYMSGLRRGMVITHMNDIPVRSHKNAILILESCKENNVNVYVKIYKPKLTRETIKSWIYKNISFKPR